MLLPSQFLPRSFLLVLFWTKSCSGRGTFSGGSRNPGMHTPLVTLAMEGWMGQRWRLAGWRLLGEHVSQSQLLRTLCNTCILPGCSIVGPILPLHWSAVVPPSTHPPSTLHPPPLFEFVLFENLNLARNL